MDENAALNRLMSGRLWYADRDGRLQSMLHGKEEEPR